MPVAIPLSRLPKHVAAQAHHIDGEDVVFFDAPSFALSHAAAVALSLVVIAGAAWSIFSVAHTDDDRLAPLHWILIALLPVWAVWLAVLAARFKRVFIVITNRSALLLSASAAVVAVDFAQIGNVDVFQHSRCSCRPGSASLVIKTHSDETYTVHGLTQAERARDLLLSSAIMATNIVTPRKPQR